MARTDARRPNIILVMADDLGYRELGCFGQEKIQTPNIDRLAEEGMKFARFYSGSPVCAPTRCCLMTGKHTGHAYVRGNREVGGWGPEEPEGQLALPDRETTVAEVLKRRGYATSAVGKWGLGGPGSEGHPCNQGFDHFYGYLCQRVAHNYYPTHLWRNHDVDVLRGNQYFNAHQRLEAAPANEADYEQYRGDDYAPAAMIEEAEGSIREHREDPFFLYFPSPIPHAGLQAPQEYVDRYPREWDPEPYLGTAGYVPTPRPRATYAAMISYLDASVGRLRATVEELGLGQDTVILFTSDNGTTFNGGCDREFFNSLGELRGTKCTVYEGGLRVPTIAWWPGRVKAGSESDHIGGSWDFLPTLAEIGGARAPKGIDGLSFMPAMLGQEQRDHEYLYFEYPERDRQQALIMGDWKGVRTNLRDGNLDIALYNLADDPGEENDLAEKHPDMVERMRKTMKSARVPSEHFPIPALDGLHAD